MKKILLVAVLMLMVSVVFAQSTNPIPSYNVYVTGQSLFVDNGASLSTTNNQILSAEKRDMNVENSGGGSNKPGDGSIIVVVIYRLDRSIVLGPYFVPSGQNINVPIDNSPWGVAVVANSGDFVSVWTNSGN
jgi:hypothetical protein